MAENGRFLVSLAVIREYQSEDSKTAEYTYVLSDEERYSWLTLRLLCHYGRIVYISFYR